MCRMSAKGLKQYTLSTGETRPGAYIVYLACESIMIDKMSYSFLGGPPMVKSAIGETVSMEDLGEPGSTPTSPAVPITSCDRRTRDREAP